MEPGLERRKPASKTEQFVREQGFGGTVHEKLMGKKISRIRHQAFSDKWNIDMGNRPKAHLFMIDLQDGGKVYVNRVVERDPFNEMLRWETDVDMSTSQDWVYQFDGQTTVEVVDPTGKRQTIKLDKEHTLESLEEYLRSTMMPIPYKEEIIE